MIVEGEVEVLVRMAEGQSIGVGELKASDIFGEVLSRLSKILVTRQRETAARKRASSIQVAQAEQIEPTKNKETNNDI